MKSPRPPPRPAVPGTPPWGCVWAIAELARAPNAPAAKNSRLFNLAPPRLPRPSNPIAAEIEQTEEDIDQIQFTVPGALSELHLPAFAHLRAEVFGCLGIVRETHVLGVPL